MNSNHSRKLYGQENYSVNTYCVQSTEQNFFFMLEIPCILIKQMIGWH